MEKTINQIKVAQAIAYLQREPAQKAWHAAAMNDEQIDSRQWAEAERKLRRNRK